MEKIICLAQLPASTDADQFRDSDMQKLAAALLARYDLHGLTLAIDDSAVAAAAGLRMQTSTALPQLVASIWLDSSNCYAALAEILTQYAADIEAYLVCESTVMDPGTTNGQRSSGSMQFCRFRALPGLAQADFIARWRGDHTKVALATQSTFGYRQNFVVATLSDNATACDAIVEEHFPLDALHSPEVFFDAKDDAEKLQRHQQQMAASCARFIDFESIDVIHMSEYVFKTPIKQGVSQ